MVVWLACDTRSSRVDAMPAADTVTLDRLALVTIGSAQPATVEVLMVREPLVIVPDDTLEPDVEPDELVP